MSTTSSPGHPAHPVGGAVVASARHGWKPSFFGAFWGVIVGGLASGFFMGAVVVLVHVVSGKPVPDAILNALEPLGYFNVVPIVVAIGIDVVCRREAFWLVTGRRSAWTLTIIAALIAPSWMIWIRWYDGGTVFWVLAASTVILRLGTTPVVAAPRWFLLRSPTQRACVVLIAMVVAIGGVLAYQIARPGLSFTPSTPSAPMAAWSTPGGPRNAYPFQLQNEIFSDVTVLGLDGWDAKFMHLERGPTRAPFTVGQGVNAGVSLVIDDRRCPGSGDVSMLNLRYRVLGVERTSYIKLARPIRWLCPTPKG